MHVGFITPEYPNERLSKVGGLGTSIKNLAICLQSEQVKVSIFVVNQDIQDVFEDQGVVIHAIKHTKRAFAQWYFNRRQTNKYINGIVTKEGIDLLEAADWAGITAFMRFSCPLVMRFHGSDTYFCHLEKRQQKRKNQLLEKWAVKRADAFIAPTTFAGNLSKKLFNIKNRTTKVIHHGLFLENFNNDNPDRYDTDSLLYLGTLIRKKGMFELVAIFNALVEQYPKAKLILVGNDSPDVKTGSASTWELMRSRFTDKALPQVDYKGKVPYSEVHEHIRSAHVCVFPTLAETFGMVTLESMALQKPVVNSNYGWAQELIDDGKNGYMVDPLNTEEYATRIVSLLKDKELSRSIGTAARNKIEAEFDIKSLVKANIDFYASLVTKG